MLYKKNGRMLDLIYLLNESIDNLLEQDVIITPYTEDVLVTKKQKFTVVENGQLPPNTDDKFYIELKDAIFYKSNVKVGDEIEIEVVDLDKMTDEGILSYFSSDEIDKKTLAKIILAQGTTLRVAGKVLKYGPKSIKRLKMLGNKVIEAKKYTDKYGKKSEHSLCYCLKLFDENADETTGDADKTIYIDTIFDQPEFIQEELENTWEFCKDKYSQYIIKKDDRQETEKSCEFLEDWYEEGEDILDDLITQLKSSFEVRGYDKDTEREKEYKSEKGVGEKIVAHDYVEIKFEEDVVHTPTGGGAVTTLFSSGNIIVFEIKKTYGSRNDTVLVEHSGKKYIMGFDTAVTKKPQSDEVFWVVDASGNVSNIKTTWTGRIMSFRD